jgi:putative ABC transport system substrate-binding protein
VPIVFDNSVDPVAGGLVDSLAHPGGNVTGYTGGLYTDKLFQILKEAVPGMSRIGLLCGCTEAELQRRAFLLAAARSVGVQVQYVDVKDSTRLARSLASTVDGRIGGLVVPPIAWMAQVHYEQIADFATTHRLPTISWYKRFAEVGGLLSYGSKLGQAHPRMAALVDKILRGAKPADLPVEQPTKFEFVINLKTAKRLGLTIPPSVLARADEVIQ